MSAEYLIGVDLGTSVVKTTLFHVDGTAVGTATKTTTIHHPAPGRAEQRPADFYAATLETIKQVVDRAELPPAAVAAIAFGGQMGGIMAIDRAGQALTPWYPSTLDRSYQPYLEQILRVPGHRERLMELGGTMPIAAPRLLLWRVEQPGLYRRIDKVLMLANYVAGKLGGLTADRAFIEPSYLGMTGLAASGQRDWSEELVALWGLEREKLPRIVPATSIIGTLTKAAADACGLVSGIPLVAGAGDQVAGFLGAGLAAPGQLIDVAGTFPVFATCLDRYLADTRYETLLSLAGPISESHWYPMMYIGGGGLTHRWFVDHFSGSRQEQAGAPGTDIYQQMDEQAATVPPGADGLLAIPHLLGRACPDDPAVRGAWLGFSWTHRPAHFYRSLLESIAYDYAQALAVIREYCPEVSFREVRVIGGGANSRLWNQIKADVLGLPYTRLPDAERATWGCAIMAGHAVGLYPDMAHTAHQLAEPVERIEVRPAYHQHYQGYASAYRRAFDQLRALYEVLADLKQQPAPP